MSNVHEVDVRGWVPYDIASKEHAQPWLARMADPVYGFRIRYGQPRQGPTNAFGGATTYYAFVIDGAEAIWESGIEKMISDLRAAGAVIEKARCQDIEAPTSWHDVQNVAVPCGSFA